MELYDVMHTRTVAICPPSDEGWHVIIVRDRETREALAALTEPAAKRYVAQLQAGESPWNALSPTHVDAQPSPERPYRPRLPSRSGAPQWF